MSAAIKCSRCDRRFREGAADCLEWNGTLKDGRVVGVLCPNCQTDAEYLEAAINEATLTYGIDQYGRHYGVPKTA
jgi:hypothetical protein